MVYYFELKDGSLIACSHRGTYMYDGKHWESTTPLNEAEAEYARMIDEDELKQLIEQRNGIHIQDNSSPYLLKIGVRNNDLSKMDGEYYLSRIPVIKQLLDGEEIDITTPVTIFVGENGTGKSTLLEAIAVGFGFNAEGGSKNFNFENHRSHSDLFKLITLGRRRVPKDGFFIRAESFYNLASEIDYLEDEQGGLLSNYGGVSLHKQSHGESFMALVRNRLFGNGLYLFDEPEAALSPARVLELMREMQRLVRCGSQFIIVTHSPILMTYPGARIIECTQDGFKERKYHELESFRFMRDFLNDPEDMLAEYLGV